MKNIFTVTASRNAANVTRLELKEPDGITDFNLTALGAVEVKIEVCSRLNNAETTCTFVNNNVDIVFGDLDLPAGIYRPKLVYYTAGNSEGIVIAGEDFDTEIVLTMVC